MTSYIVPPVGWTPEAALWVSGNALTWCGRCRCATDHNTPAHGQPRPSEAQPTTDQEGTA